MSVPLIGREMDFERTCALLTSTASGLVVGLIEGEAGIGKSALAQAVATRATAGGWTVVFCRATQSEARYSFVGLADLIGPLATPETLARLPRAQRRGLEIALRRIDSEIDQIKHAIDVPLLGMAVHSLLASVGGFSRVLILLDDVQWLDPATAAVLSFALRRTGTDLRLLTTRRAKQPGQLPLSLERHVAPSARISVWLDGLNPTDLHALLHAHLDIRLDYTALRRLHHLCQGNPFHALQIIQTVRARMAGSTAGRPIPLPAAFPLPNSIEEALDHKLTGVDDRVQSMLLLVASMARPTVDRIHLAMIGLSFDDIPGNDRRGIADHSIDETINRAEQAGLLTVNGDRIEFTHPLFAAAVYARTSQTVRRHMHAHLATVETEPEARARHLGLALTGPQSTVATALEEAAADARSRGATEVAVELLRLALNRTPPDDGQSRARRVVRLGEVLFEAGDLDATATWLDEQTPTLPSGILRAHALMTRGVVEWYQSGGDAARALLRQAVDDAQDDPILLGTIHSRLSVFSDADAASAREHAARAVEVLRPAGESDLLGCAMCNLFYYEVLAGDVPRPDLLRDGLRMEDPRGTTDQATTPGFWHLAIDEFDQARSRFQTLLDRDQARGELATEPDLLTRLGEVAVYAGNWARARKYAQAANASANQLGHDASYRPGRRLLLQLDLLEGDLSQAPAALAEAERFERLGGRFPAASYLALAAFAAASAGDHHQVLALTERAGAHLAAVGIVEPLGRYDPAPERAEALVAAGALDAARSLLDTMTRRLDRVPRPWLAAARLRAEALLTAARGDVLEAVAVTEPVLDPDPHGWSGFELARTLLTRGRLLRRARRTGDAERCLAEAATIFDQLGATAWLATTQDERSRVRRKRPAIDAPKLIPATQIRPTAREPAPHITATERRIAELVAGGATNRDMAATLHMSPKTVEVHLTRLYGKLGIRSRAELGAIVGAGLL